MNQAELAKALSRELRVSVREADRVMEAMIRVMGRTLAQHEPICFSNFGSFRPVRRRPRSFGVQAHARSVRPDTLQVQFKAADKLLEAVEAGDDRVTFQKRPNRLPRALPESA